jgi:hypothetical protein
MKGVSMAAPEAATKNQGTKPGFRHRPHQTRQQRRTELTAQVAATGQYGIVLPPQHRVRPDKLEPARPLNSAEREGRYVRQAMGIPASVDLSAVFVAATIVGSPDRTAAQAKRLRKKLGHSVAKSRGKPAGRTKRPLAKTPVGTSQPRSGQLSRGFRKMLGRLSPRDRDRALLSWLSR